ncbi:MAG TPA: nuclear transport factor 2 family protein [Gammaproteobacteria bacterium]
MAPEETLTAADVTRWLARYEAAWEGRDPDAAAALFTPDALYHETPYAEPFRGPDGVRDYWARVTADQRDVDFSFEVVAVAGRTGVARWHAAFELASSGAPVELDGVFLLEFASNDRVRVLREWWHAR